MDDECFEFEGTGRAAVPMTGSQTADTKASEDASASLLALLVPGPGALVVVARLATGGLLVGFVLSRILVGRELVEPLASNWGIFSATAVLGALVLGSGAKLRDTWFARVHRTHAELPSVLSPVGASYGAMLFALAVSIGKALGDGRPLLEALVLAGFASTLVVATIAVYAAAGTASALIEQRLAPKKKSDMAKATLLVDAPIRTWDDDRLSRRPVVDQLVTQIEAFRDASPGYLALVGPWGVGKSSVVALARPELAGRGYVPVNFSSFRFAASGGLVDGLASTLAEALADRWAAREPSRTVLRYARALKPALDRVLPLALPLSVPTPDETLDDLRQLLSKASQPVIVFIDDIDRLTPDQVRTLLAATRTFDELPGLEFVLVTDRDRLEDGLAASGGSGSDRDFIDKFIHSTVVVPPASDAALFAEFDHLLDEVLERHGVALREDRDVPRRTWTAFIRTLRDAKHIANRFSSVLADLKGEVDAYDLLLASVLDEFVPGLLERVPDAGGTWLTGMPLLLEAEEVFSRPLGQRRDRHADRNAWVDRVVGDDPRSGAIKSLLEHLFTDRLGLDPLLKGQRLASYEYLARYRDRQVGATSVSDQSVAELIAELSAHPGEADTAMSRAMQASPNLGSLLVKLATRHDELSPATHGGVMQALAEESESFPAGRDRWVKDARDFALVLTQQLLQAHHGDPAWQEERLVSIASASTSLGYLRELIGRIKNPESGIVERDAALDDPRLMSIGADGVRRRIAEGYNPFSTEPAEAPYIVACVGDPVEAARLAIQLGGTEGVLNGYRWNGPPEEPPQWEWNKLAANYDIPTLANGIDPALDLSEGQTALRAHASELPARGAAAQESEARPARARRTARRPSSRTGQRPNAQANPPPQGPEHETQS